MTADAVKALQEFKPKKEFFVGIDSDGCVFDTMEIKQKECFIPNIIKHWRLQAVSKYVRQTAEFVNLWRHMFDYLTYAKKLDNLLWIYSASARGDCLDFYPGNEYVDMVGVDSYGRTIAEIRKNGYAQLTNLRKPFALTEFGPYKQLNWAENPRNDYDYGQFIREVAEQMPLCTSFLIWHQFHGLQFQQNAQQCLDHPWTVNRTDLPTFGRQAGPSSPSAGEARKQ